MFSDMVNKSSRALSSARDLTKVMVEKVADTVAVAVSKGMRASEFSVALIKNDATAILNFFSDKTKNAQEYIKLLVRTETITIFAMCTTMYSSFCKPVCALCARTTLLSC